MLIDIIVAIRVIYQRAVTHLEVDFTTWHMNLIDGMFCLNYVKVISKWPLGFDRTIV